MKILEKGQNKVTKGVANIKIARNYVKQHHEEHSNKTELLSNSVIDDLVFYIFFSEDSGTCIWINISSGAIKRADVKTNEDGRSKGVGTVTFDCPEDANRAVCIFSQQNYLNQKIENCWNQKLLKSKIIDK